MLSSVLLSHCYRLFYQTTYTVYWDAQVSKRLAMLKMCHTERPHTLGKWSAIQRIPIFLWLWSSIITVPQSLSAIQGVSFSQRVPGKMGTPGPHFPGTAWYGNLRSPFSHFHMTVELNMRAAWELQCLSDSRNTYLLQIYWLLSTLLIPCILVLFDDFIFGPNSHVNWPDYNNVPVIECGWSHAYLSV